MESLSEQQKTFLKKRTKTVHSWPIAGIMIIFLELGLAAWLLWKHPLLINPQAVMSKLRSGSLPDSTLSLMATFLPFVIIACLGLLAVLILFAFLALANEKKHMDIIQALQRDNPARGSDRKN
jgi:type VI protein secretion system component VasF